MPNRCRVFCLAWHLVRTRQPTRVRTHPKPEPGRGRQRDADANADADGNADADADTMEPGFHCVRTEWIRGFMTFWLTRRRRFAMLVVLM